MRVRKTVSKAVALLCALGAVLAVSCASAGAEVTHKYQSSITFVPGEGPGGEPVAKPGLLRVPISMTVDGHELYLAEQLPENGTRIDVFDTTDNAFIRQLNPPASSVEGAYEGIAVGHATGSTEAYVGAGERIEGELHSIVVAYDAEGHQLGAPWKGEDTPAGSFSGNEAPSGDELEGVLRDVAVDNDPTSLSGDWAAGDVFVVTASTITSAYPGMNVVDIFAPEADGGEKYVTQLTGTCESPGTCPGEVVPFYAPRHVAIDSRNGDLLVLDETESGHPVVDRFRPGLLDEYEFAGTTTGSSGGSFGAGTNSIAIDSGEGAFAEGTFYVEEKFENGAGEHRAAVYQFNAEGQYVGQFSAVTEFRGYEANSVTVDPASHDLYVAVDEPVTEEGEIKTFGPSLLLPDVETDPASKVAPQSATLNGAVNPQEAGSETTCWFMWGTSESFGHKTPCAEPVTEGKSTVPVSVQLEGLDPGTTYYYRLQAGNGNGTNEGLASQTLSFTTSGPELVEESASAIASTSATLGGSINPDGSDTSWYFQYGTSSAYGSETPAAPGESIGAGEDAVEVTRHVQGLAPSTVYHYRVVVTSQLEVEPGVFKEATFDGHDQTFTTQPLGGSLALPDGRAWELVSPANKDGAIIVPLQPEAPVGILQASASGDAFAYGTSTPSEAAAPGYAEGEQILSNRTAGGWSSQDIGLPHASSTGLVVGHGGDYRFFSEDLTLGIAEPIGPFTSLAPEVSPPDTERTPYLRHDATCATQSSTCYLPLVTGAPGYSDVPTGTVFDPETSSHVSGVRFASGTGDLDHVLLESMVALTPEAITEHGLYEWSGNKPPAEQLQLVSGEDARVPLQGRDAISSDGAHVVFESRVGPAHLYLRDMAHGRTVQLDEVQAGASGAGAVQAVFQAANSQGTAIYFTDTQSLTKSAGAHQEEPDLYECRLIEATSEDKCALTDITPERNGKRADVQGAVIGASEDGAYVYFVAHGVLTAQPSSNGEEAVAGAPNLYEGHTGAVELVTVLSSKDNSDWARETQDHTARVSTNGRYVAFMSDRSLTGYDNVDVSSGTRDEEVYLFDASAGRLACASCNPSGARPNGAESEGSGSSPGQAASVPGWTPYGTAGSLYQSRYLSDSGRLFFDSSDALVPQDINKAEDVYEYEPAGIGGCSASLPTYDQGAGGCVGLISSGTARGESTFMDASANGDDVFFLTSERLAANDVDTSTDVYDAHVCSAVAPCLSVPSSPPPCTTADACRAAPSPQPAIFGSPASGTFSGSGNLAQKAPRASKPKSLTRKQKLARALKICRRKAKHTRAACERRARRTYSNKRTRRARGRKGGKG